MNVSYPEVTTSVSSQQVRGPQLANWNGAATAAAAAGQMMIH